MKNHYAQNILRTTNTLFENLEEVRVSQEQNFNNIEQDINKLKKSLSKNTKKSRFLRTLEYDKLYTENDLLELIENAGYKQPKSFIVGLLRANQNYGIKISVPLFINETDYRYKINPELKKLYD